MWCKLCSKYDKQTKWNINKDYFDKKTQKKCKGISRFKLDGIRDHMSSEKHKNAENLELDAKRLTKQFHTLFDKARNEIKKIMSIALYVTTEKLSTLKYVSLCEFVKSLNVSLTSNELYCSRYGYIEIIKVFNEVIIKEQTKLIQKSGSFSLIVDESTDICGTKDLMIYTKYFNEHKAQMVTEFLKIVKLNDFSGKAIASTLNGINLKSINVI